jgi:hypothetical protein
MEKARRLRKAEREIVERAATLSFARVREPVLAIEREIVENLLSSVPRELVGAAVREFMNMLGRELSMEADLGTLLKDG